MKIEDYMDWKRLTVRQFAKQCGIASSYLWAIKNGKRPASRDAALKIRKASDGNITLDDIFGDKTVITKSGAK